MERLRRVVNLIFRNLYYYRVDYIRTFVVLRIVQAFIVIPFISLIITLIMDVTGVHAITENNIMQLVTHPFALAGIGLILLIGVLFIYYEMGFLMLLAYHQQCAIPYTWKRLLKRLNQKVVHFISLQTLLLVIYLLLLIPLISSILPISLIQNFTIPRFIIDELLNSRNGTILYVTVIVVLGFISLRFIFTWPFFTIYQGISIFQALKMSWKFSQRKLVELIGIIAVIVLIHLSLLITVLTITFIPLLIIEAIVPSWGLVVAGFTLTFAEGVIVLFFSILQIISSQLLVMVAFSSTHFKPLILQEESFRQTIRQWTILISIYAFFLISGINLLNLEKTLYEPESIVIAHRGFMERGVENTISSIKESAKAGAEVVEIDIQQTKDGQFVVFHDETLSRLARKPNRVHQMTLKELTETTVSADGHTDKIPSLEEVLQTSRLLNIQLLIEIKPHGYETKDMLERLVAQLDAHDALDIHYVQSLDIKLMEELEALEPRIKTGFVYAVAYGSIPLMDADFVAIEQSFATSAIQEQVNAAGKELFVWTVNNERGLQHFYEWNIDGIITNHPDIAVSIRKQFDEQNNFVKRVLNKITIIY
ncbi:MAG: glycerophosphodiester phosphodiesterase [Solibacillus sp.]|uniref:glycerophosphodiester phosphodiesterase n=1 Tax=unclassified Solibacillus TaxID=2637870 RepID=UPI0030FC9ED4